MERILEILSEVRPDIDFESEMELIDGGWLDSFDVVSIISDLNDEYEINIRVTDLSAENFNSLEAIRNLEERKQHES
jgi:acyl carrier protein